MGSISDDIYQLATIENRAISILAQAIIEIINNGSGGGSTPDLSGYAKTEDLNTANAFQAIDPTLGIPAPDFLDNVLTNINGKIDGVDGSIPDLSGYATTEDLNTTNSFQAIDPTLGIPAPDFLDNVLTNINGKIDGVGGSTPDLSGYATTEDLNTAVDTSTTFVALDPSTSTYNPLDAVLANIYAAPVQLVKEIVENPDFLNVIATKVSKEIIETPDYLSAIVKNITDAITSENGTS